MNGLRFGSVCSGIEAASVAWAPLGWKAAWLSEIEPFPCDLLAHHYPDVPNLGDMTTIAPRILAGEVEAPDVFCGGTPCQAFSLAGNRKSLSDARGNLSLTFCEIANAIDSARSVRGKQSAIIFWENVPGATNTADNFFGCFLAELAGETVQLEPPGGKWTNAGVVSGPTRTVAWRILDAQHFGVAQRRRRIFVLAVGHDRKGIDPAQILFEWSGVRRDSAPDRSQERQSAATGTGAPDNCWWDGGQVSQTLDAVLYKKQAMPEKNRFPAVIDGGKLRFITPTEAERLQGFPDGYTNIPKKVVADYGNGPCAKQVVKATVVAKNGTHFVATNHCDTPQTTCARAGMPTGDGYELCRTICGQRNHAEPNAIRLAGKHANGATLYIEGHTYACQHCTAAAEAAGISEIVIGQPPGTAPDGPRYKALGNSWAVPVVRWIGQRIHNAVDASRTPAADNDNLESGEAVA